MPLIKHMVGRICLGTFYFWIIWCKSQ